MTIPHKINVKDDVEDDQIDDLIFSWMDDNRGTLHNLSLAGCLALAQHTDIYNIPIAEFIYTHSFDDSEEIIAELGVDRDGVYDTLDEIQDWYVSIEDYESAATVVACRKSIEKQ